jgi:hypothetical protein
MLDIEFRKLVRNMRHAQRQYFRTRRDLDPQKKDQWLKLSKEFEKMVDHELRDDGQQTLFGSET